MKIRWPSFSLPPINLWNAPHQPALEDTMTEIAERDAVQDQLCARIEELEIEKEALAAQLDKAEEQMAVLRSQADALHRIGYVLDIDPGDDLTKEAPAIAEALVSKEKRWFSAYVQLVGAEQTQDAGTLEYMSLVTDSLMAEFDAIAEDKLATSLAIHDAELLGKLAMRWDREGDAQLESGCSGIEHRGRGRKYAACLAANESNRIRREAQGGEL